MNVEDMNRNRRNDPAVDRDLTVTRVDRADGSPMAVLVNWTAHPTIMDEEDMWVSAGWPGYLQRELEALIDGCPMAMYYNGAQGDQSVLRPEGASHYEQAEQYGRAMAVRALKVYRSIKTEKTPVFTFAYSRFALPKPVSHKAFKDTGGDEYAIDDPVMQVILTQLCPSHSETVALRLGGLLIAGVPGELACGLGIEVKKKLSQAGIPYPVIGGLANEWISYILAREQYQKGGYEASVSFFGPSLGDSVVNGMTETALTLKEK